MKKRRPKDGEQKEAVKGEGRKSKALCLYRKEKTADIQKKNGKRKEVIGKEKRRRRNTGRVAIRKRKKGAEDLKSMLIYRKNRQGRQKVHTPHIPRRGKDPGKGKR